jgi:hypothetical protein
MNLYAWYRQIMKQNQTMFFFFSFLGGFFTNAFFNTASSAASQIAGGGLEDAGIESRTLVTMACGSQAL